MASKTTAVRRQVRADDKAGHDPVADITRVLREVAKDYPAFVLTGNDTSLRQLQQSVHALQFNVDRLAAKVL